MTTATLTQLRESVKSPNLKVDREEGVIRDVKILGRESQNGRTYSQNALEEACRLYQNIKVNIDHPDRSNPGADRKFEEGFGELRNCKVTTSGVFGDLHFPKSHPKTNLVCEYAERFPKLFGLSHNAEGELIQKDGSWVVESIYSVHSVDIVSQPATNAGLFESVGHGRRHPKMVSLREVKRVMRHTGCVIPSMKLLFEAMHSGVIDPNTKVEVPPEVEDQFKDAVEMSTADIADANELTFAPDKLQEVKAIVIRMLAKKSSSGEQTADDIQEVNDFIDNGIAMLEKMFQAEFSGESQSRSDDSDILIPETAGEFVESLRGLRRSNPSGIKALVESIRKRPTETRTSARQQRLRESRITKSEDTNWRPSADAKEFASRLRKS